MIRAEAEAEPFEGQVAVGAVVLNRVESPEYPNTITDVIYQVDQGYVQFTPVANGTINLPPTEQAIEAADRALAGEDPSLGAIGFYNPSKSYDPWVRTRPVTAIIGNHVFFK
ncbi:MAG TPA: cell wall hydrolase [Firmicutes bacterium]|nr:cell wall hydrolase [Bacillota bacterium]